MGPEPGRGLRLYNTMNRGVEQFRPRRKGEVKVFTCGPSVYRSPHLGNWRTFLYEDLLVRHLEYLGYSVERALNFTDVEDKAIAEARAKGQRLSQATEPAAEQFMTEAAQLDIKLPEPIRRSSTSVGEAATIIKRLLDKGHAYWHKGDVFFDPLTYEGFGRLYGLDMSRWPRRKVRFKKDTYPGQRWNLGDFILWHGCRHKDMECWETELGRGRPSWNIQDPAMVLQSLGEQMDIWCGGADNLYRHHDYNLAVMEAYSGRELARFWLHGAPLLVRGVKMSKSRGNVVYLADVLGQGYTARQVRFLDRKSVV